jgi:hypothetical protein
MPRMSSAASDARERALKGALTEVLGTDAWVDEAPDLYHAMDELTMGDETLVHLATAEGELQYADRELRDRHDRDADGMRLDREADARASEAERAVADAAKAYAVELVEERLDDAREYLGGDVTLDELEGSA